MTPKRLVPLFVTAACALGVAPAAALGASNVAQASSQNWSGYVIGASAASGASSLGSGRRFSSVTASWTQPTASCPAGSAGYAAFWVGLGGSGSSQALEQAGTEANCSSSAQPSYYAWYELVPKAPVRLGLAIHAGDRVTSTVSVSGTTVRIRLADLTSGLSADQTLTMANPDVSSAEWIAEAPSACDATVTSCTPLPLTDFGAVRFAGARATTTEGHTGAISDANWSTAAVSLSGSVSSFGAQTSAPMTPGLAVGRRPRACRPTAARSRSATRRRRARVRRSPENRPRPTQGSRAAGTATVATGPLVTATPATAAEERATGTAPQGVTEPTRHAARGRPRRARSGAGGRCARRARSRRAARHRRR